VVARSRCDGAVYCRRPVIERCVGWLKEARRVATRFAKLAVHYLGVLKLMMIRKHLKFCLSNTP
jgi:transposase